MCLCNCRRFRITSIYAWYHGGAEAADLATDPERVEADEEGVAQPGQGGDLYLCIFRRERETRERESSRQRTREKESEKEERTFFPTRLRA